jgi:hypothetical protein
MMQRITQADVILHFILLAGLNNWFGGMKPTILTMKLKISNSRMESMLCIKNYLPYYLLSNC